MTRSAQPTNDPEMPRAVPKPDRRSKPSQDQSRLPRDEADKRDEADNHVGATEDQVTPTTPPNPNDDEPKQG